MPRVCSPLPLAGEGLGERAGAGNCEGLNFVEAPALSPALSRKLEREYTVSGSTDKSQWSRHWFFFDLKTCTKAPKRTPADSAPAWFSRSTAARRRAAARAPRRRRARR
ncbi:protein of unknown function [Cupriavidus taiwanensis]|uniref:Uncharacterized protein n=1 Tax=Cupriavidus taiwanensis TaxID=164546 RepID=A0A375IGY1_9BURK|nr:protein of unknown function [Cupriavidus taiwanensis]